MDFAAVLRCRRPILDRWLVLIPTGHRSAGGLVCFRTTSTSVTRGSSRTCSCAEQRKRTTLDEKRAANRPPALFVSTDPNYFGVSGGFSPGFGGGFFGGGGGGAARVQPAVAVQALARPAGGGATAGGRRRTNSRRRWRLHLPLLRRWWWRRWLYAPLLRWRRGRRRWRLWRNRPHDIRLRLRSRLSSRRRSATCTRRRMQVATFFAALKPLAGAYAPGARSGVAWVQLSAR